LDPGQRAAKFGACCAALWVENPLYTLKIAGSVAAPRPITGRDDGEMLFRKRVRGHSGRWTFAVQEKNDRSIQAAALHAAE
jgi:hypothetical protein